MDVKIIECVSDFEALESSWNELYESSGDNCPFISYYWVKTILETDSSAMVKIITISKNSKLLCALPMKVVEERVIAGIKKKFLTHACDKYTDFCEILIDSKHEPKKLLKLLVKNIVSQVESVNFLKVDNITSRKQINRIFLKLLREQDLYKTAYVNVHNPILTFSDLKWITKKQFKDTERRTKRLREQNDIEFYIDQTIKPDSEHWEHLVNFHKETFPEIGFNSKSNQAFYNSLVESGFDWKATDFSYMTINGEVAACHFGFKGTKKFYYYVPAYASRYKKQSAGMLLMSNIISHYKEKGFEEFDFLRGSEPYKLDWMSDDCSNYSFIAANKNKVFDKLLISLFVLKKTLPFNGVRG